MPRRIWNKKLPKDKRFPRMRRRSISPSPKDVNNLVSWLKAQGFEIVQVSPESGSVYAKAPASQIERSLDVNMVRVTKDGISYTAAQNAPSLPDDVGQGVQAILGLQPFRQAHKHCRMRMPHREEDTTASHDTGVASGAQAAAPARKAHLRPPYMVKDILKAYDADNLNLTGKGQTIAILIDTFPEDSDLQAFWNANNLNITLGQIEKINVSGDPLPPHRRRRNARRFLGQRHRAGRQDPDLRRRHSRVRGSRQGP